MLTILLGASLMFYGISDNVELLDLEPHEIYFEHPAGYVLNERVASDITLRHLKYKNLTRQQYDYSCGSAALTTLYNQFLGHKLKESQVMEGLLKFGEKERIVREHNFSFLDMKRLSNALGYKAGGFKATYQDILELEQPAIVPIEYAGFSHFVVIKTVVDGHVLVADPSLGNISFPEKRFQEVWAKKVLFLTFPREGQKSYNLFAYDDDHLRVIADATMTRVAELVLSSAIDINALEEQRDETYTRSLVGDGLYDLVYIGGKPRREEYSERFYFKNK